eukprot:jgi/Galph1/4994/GphlegSOOS_G3641.1
MASLVGFDSTVVVEQNDTSSRDSLKTARKRTPTVRQGSFEALGLNNVLVSNLKRLGYSFPTPIQRKAIPPLLQGRDAVLMARTGSGKTAAFLLPTLKRLYDADPWKMSNIVVGIRCLVISPTRELALQTFSFVKKYAKGLNLRAASIVGGEQLEVQFATLAANPDIVVATPGRFLQIMEQAPLIRFQSIETLVLDEADRLFEGDLSKDTRSITDLLFSADNSSISSSCQKILVSATLPQVLAAFAQMNMNNPAFIRLDLKHVISSNVAVAFFGIQQDERVAGLLYFINSILCNLPRSNVLDYSKNSSNFPKTLIFVASRYQVDFLEQILRLKNIPAAGVHGGKDSTTRKLAMQDLRSGRVPILIVTDIAARGLDIPFLDVVVNFDFPPTPKLFIHRVGRTGRAGRFGCIISFVSSDELPYLLDLLLFLGRDFCSASKDSPEVDTLGNEACLLNSSFVYGRLPNLELSDEVDTLRNLVDTYVDLYYSSNCAENGYKKYKRTRPNASGASIKRVKEMSQTIQQHLVHPWFQKGQISEQTNHFVQQLRTWRPPAAVIDPLFNNSKGYVPRTQAAEKLTVTVDDSTRLSLSLPLPEKSERIGLKKMSRKEILAKERAYFIGGERSKGDVIREKAFSIQNGGAMADSMNDAVLDIIQDDPDEEESRRRSLKWDRKKKKFVTVVGIERQKQGRKKVGETTKSHFSKWMDKTKVRIQSVGEEADRENMELAQLRSTCIRETKVSGAKRNELKKPEQIRKERKKKALINKKKLAKASKLKTPKEPRPSKQGLGAKRRSIAIVKF